MNTIDLRNNYLNNSSFENGSLSWINSANYIADNDSDIFDANMMGNKYLKLKNGSVSQEVYVNGNKDDIFVYGASALFNNDIARGIINLTFTYIDGTVGMSRDEKLLYIRYLKEKEPYNYRNWTEAQMMREFEYHDRGYALTSIFGNPFGFTNRFEKVDFEEDQKPCTYFYRTIGNMMFW